MKDLLKKGQALAVKLGNMPSNELTPTAYKALIASMGGSEIHAENVGIEAVGRASLHRGGLMELSKTKDESPIVFVGKGITFDSGGLSLKPGSGMGDMGFDMMGSAVVLGSVTAGAQVVAELCIAENLIAANAYKPGDVLKYPNGVSVYVDNTDAEGRLVLADGLIQAVRKKPRLIVTVATLTGAVVAALGHETFGVFSSDLDLANKVVKIAEDVGEKGWVLPLLEDECLKKLKHPRATLMNCAAGVPGHSSAATFLRQFVPRDIPYVHLDIAGVAYKNKIARSVGVKTLLEISKRF